MFYAMVYGLRKNVLKGASMQQPQSPNIDLEFGLKQLSGNKSLLLRMLNKFKEEYRDVMHKLQHHLDDGEYTDAHRIIHTIKGVAGNLGLSSLHHISREYEAFLKGQQPDIDSAKKQFQQILENTLIEIEQLDEASLDAAPTQQAVVSTAGKQDLIEALKRNEFIPPAKLDEMLTNSRLEANVEQQIREHISDLEYPEAIDLLQSH